MAPHYGLLKLPGIYIKWCLFQRHCQVVKIFYKREAEGKNSKYLVCGTQASIKKNDEPFQLASDIVRHL